MRQDRGSTNDLEPSRNRTDRGVARETYTSKSRGLPSFHSDSDGPKEFVRSPTIFVRNKRAPPPPSPDTGITLRLFIPSFVSPSRSLCAIPGTPLLGGRTCTNEARRRWDWRKDPADKANGNWLILLNPSFSWTNRYIIETMNSGLDLKVKKIIQRPTSINDKIPFFHFHFLPRSRDLFRK